MAGAAIGQHPAPQALERAAATEQQAHVFALALDQKRQECLVQDTLAGMSFDAIDGSERFARRGIDRHDLGTRTALIPAARKMRAAVSSSATMSSFVVLSTAAASRPCSPVQHENPCLRLPAHQSA